MKIQTKNALESIYPVGSTFDGNFGFFGNEGTGKLIVPPKPIEQDDIEDPLDDYTSNGYTYNGSFLDGYMHGEGQQIAEGYDDEDPDILYRRIYNGEFVKGKKEGYGIEIMEVYDRADTAIEKYGIEIIERDGIEITELYTKVDTTIEYLKIHIYTYCGTFRNDLKTGEADFYSQDYESGFKKTKYKMVFADDKPLHFKYFEKNGNKYKFDYPIDSGDLLTPSGEVNIEYPNNIKFNGKLLEGIKSGYGILQLNESQIYTGDFEDNIIHNVSLNDIKIEGSYKFDENTGIVKLV